MENGMEVTTLLDLLRGIPTQHDVNRAIEERIAVAHPHVAENERKAKDEVRSAAQVRKAIKDQADEARKNGSPLTEQLALYEALADAAIREAVAAQDASNRLRQAEVLFHRKRAEVYREAIGAMRRLAESGARVTELERRIRRAEQAREKLGAILRHVEKGKFLFSAGPIDVFENHLGAVQRLLEAD